MPEIPIDIAVEDQLSELVVLKLLEVADRSFHVGTTYRRGGFGYLRSKINGWNAAAKGRPFLVLTDLDDGKCPSALIAEWFTSAIHPNLIFRVAVREVEAWLLADAENLAAYFRIAAKHLPCDPDTIADPKVALIELARKSRVADVRASLIPRALSTAKQGPGHNEFLGAFVREKWNVREAAGRSPSLRRALSRIETFQPIWNPEF